MVLILMDERFVQMAWHDCVRVSIVLPTIYYKD